MTLFRVHRGGLAKSLEDCIEVADLSDIANYLNTIWTVGPSVELASLTCEPYAYDPRIDWNTYIILQNGQIIGFSNGPLERFRKEGT